MKKSKERLADTSMSAVIDQEEAENRSFTNEFQETDTAWTIGDEFERSLIEKRAYELYELRGREDGHALEDWVQAEEEFKSSNRT
jgi:hypothetical protein